MRALRKLLDLLTPSEREHAALLLGMMLVSAFLDMVGVASIMPFIAVLANPELVETNVLINSAFTAAINFGIHTEEQFLLALGLIVFAALVISLAFKALTTYAQLRFTLMREYSIGKRLVEGYMQQPYSWFLSRHSTDLGKTILSEVNTVVFSAVHPMMTLIAQGAVLVALLMLLILIDPKLALFSCLTLIAAYAVVFRLTCRFLTRIGEERVKANQSRFTAISEAFCATKEIKVGRLEQAYIKRFSAPAQIYAQHQTTSQMISQLPRFALEAIAFGGMLLVLLYLMAQSHDFASVLPIIALYAFAGYRLLPALQQCYWAVTQLRFAGPALDNLQADLVSLKTVQPSPSQGALRLNQDIRLNHIQYSYPNAPFPILKDFSLVIPARSMVGLIGATGSGKTTTVDLILGLLEAQKGTLEVDGKPITEFNRRAWQRGIGYAPQQVYMADDTVSANIAFGLEDKDISQDAVERAAKVAMLHDFVYSNLPQKYQTTVGERGIRLSGGERQRIGIARALYHKPQVLILDEATSALDDTTERAVMEALRNLGHEITIIIIAHRLSTVEACDTVFLLERGEIKGQGSYQELQSSSAEFRRMRGNSV